MCPAVIAIQMVCLYSFWSVVFRLEVPWIQRKGANVNLADVLSRYCASEKCPTDEKNAAVYYGLGLEML